MEENTENDARGGFSQNQNPYRKISVPTQYREGAKILKQIVEEGKSLKELVYNNKHIKTGSTIALLNKIQAREKQLDHIIGKTDILRKIPNKYLGKYLVAELVFGRGELNGFSKPVECVKALKDVLMEALIEFSGDEPTAIEAVNFYHKVPRYIRLNTNLMKKTEAKEYLEREGWRKIENSFESYSDFIEAVKNLDDESYLADFNIKNCFVFPPSSKKYWAANELAAEGKFLLQDKASCLPSFLLDPPPKSIVLDMCSAPGNKSTHLACIMKNKGKVYSVEMNPKRFGILVETVEGTHSTIVQPMNRDVLEITDEDVPNVEYILLDPSCSGSGIANRFASDSHKDKERLFKLSGIQFKLLSHAMTAFPNVKRIIYSTCSIYCEENEEVVLGCLRNNGHFKLVDIRETFNEHQWKNYGNEVVYPNLGDKVLYARTEDDFTNGFFVAILERCEEGESNEFFTQKQQNIAEHKDKEGTAKRKIVSDDVNIDGAEEEDEAAEEKPAKKLKKKWKNKMYQ